MVEFGKSPVSGLLSREWWLVCVSMSNCHVGSCCVSYLTYPTTGSEISGNCCTHPLQFFLFFRFFRFLVRRKPPVYSARAGRRFTFYSYDRCARMSDSSLAESSTMHSHVTSLKNLRIWWFATECRGLPAPAHT